MKRTYYKLSGKDLQGVDWSTGFDWIPSNVRYTGTMIEIEAGSPVIVGSKQVYKSWATIFAQVGGIWGAWMIFINLCYVDLPRKKGQKKEYMWRFHDIRKVGQGST